MKRIGIVNRGEPAVRFLDALTELRHERPGAPEAVALHVAADARSLYVRRAPHAVCIGEGRAAFLDAANVLAALRGASCDAAWLGWGFASEDAGFAATLEAAGITLLAPRSETMAALGDKIRAKQVAEQHGVPVAPWAIVEDAAQARIEADRIGYPLLVKAAGGGGGRGIRPVDGPEQLAGALVSAREEALRSFGSGALLLERLVTGARHVEVQVLGDGEGRVITLGVRDCSLQRRRQKVIEECPSPALPPAVARHLEEAAARLCGALRYRSAGTVEFLYAPAEGLSCFLEVNTRLQVEHPITEAVHGVDLVRAQILLALGEPLPEVPAPRGHAVEARVTAEDARSGFTPAPGRLERVVWPVGPGIRVDAGFAEGEVLSPDFDPLVAKIIAHGSTRAVALGRLARALDQTTLVVQGGQTNLDFLRSLLDHPAVQAGTADTGLLDRLQPEPPAGAAAARVMAAIDRFLAEGDRAGAGADRHRVDVGQELGVYRTGEHCFRLVAADGALTARCWPEGRTGAQLELDGRVHRIERAPGDLNYVVDGVAHRVQANAQGVVAAPSMAIVLALPVEVGAVVAAGETVAVLESMKMEVRVDAPVAGRVAGVRVRLGDQVRPGQPLVLLEPEGVEAAPATGPSLPWSREPPPPERAAIRLTTAVIGWDIEPGRFESDLQRLDGPGCLKLLNTFADIAELFEGRSRSESWRG
ncbi:MAG: biotin carboxylase N-terminal domain-containing protein [bacterium]